LQCEPGVKLHPVGGPQTYPGGGMAWGLGFSLLGFRRRSLTVHRHGA
jgi:hypothetical protein